MSRSRILKNLEHPRIMNNLALMLVFTTFLRCDFAHQLSDTLGHTNMPPGYNEVTMLSALYIYEDNLKTKD